MDWNRVQGSWNSWKAKSKRSGVSSLMMTSLPSMDAVRNSKARFQQRYGVAKDQARQQVDDWFASQGF